MENTPAYTAKNVEFISYHDLDGNPGFKLAMQVAGNKWYLYIADFWRPYITILDVTDPSHPLKLNEVLAGGPVNTCVLNLQVAEGMMISSMEKTIIGRPEDFDPAKGFDEGITLWDVKTDPVHPKKLSVWKTGGGGTHRNHFSGDGYVHLTARMPGYNGYIYVIVNVRDPMHPNEIGRWFVPEQYTAGGGVINERYNGLHGPAQVEGDRAYLPYGTSGAVILDISDYRCPKLVSRLTFGNALGNYLGVHSYVPIKSRNLAIISGEAVAEESREPMSYAMLADISDEKNPRVLSFFPVPVPEPGATYQNFQTRGGRCGPHNWNVPQDKSYIYSGDRIVYNAYFNAGLRIFDISDPYVPKEAGFFLPEDPKERRGILPRNSLTTSSEDVLVDSRGYAYLTDKNHGLFIVRYTGSR